MSKTKKSRRGLFLSLASGSLLIFTLIVLWLTFKVISYEKLADEVVDSVGTFRTHVVAGDFHASKVAADALQQRVTELKEIPQDPLWKVAAQVPMVGSNFHALSEISVSLNDLVTRGLLPIIVQIDDADYKQLADNPFDFGIDKIERLAPTLTSSAAAIQVSYDRLDGLDTKYLLGPIRDPLNNHLRALDGVRQTMNSLALASQLVPPMMGVDEAREYLVLIQNNAEARATGGIPGAMVVLRVEGGEFSFVDQASAEELGVFRPALDVDPLQAAIFTTRLGTHMQNVNLTPDFPTAASTALKMWAERRGTALDGVLAIDPVVLANLLEVSGPVQLEDPQILEIMGGTSLPRALTKENVVPTLLSSVYSDISDPSVQDAYFAAAAERVFDVFNVARSDIDTGSSLFAPLKRSVAEGRILLWSAHEDEQQTLNSTPLSGSMTSVKGAAFGMYFNDGTGAKMDYYVDRKVQLIQTCFEDGYSSYRVRMSATNTAPSDASDSLPAYVTGDGAFGVERGNVRTNYVAYGPAQSLLQTAAVNGESVPFASGVHAQRPVGTVTVELPPGESAELEFTFVRVVQDTDPNLAVTPTARSMSDVILPPIREAGCG